MSLLEKQKTFNEWFKLSWDSYPQFFYWNTVFELQLLLNEYIRAQREGNFLLYVDILDQIMPWLFALDHVHYARWLPIHIRDLSGLEVAHPALFGEFKNDNFVVQRSNHRFSLMVLDQSHEQSIKSMKGEGEAVGLFADPAALRRWMIAGPEVSRAVTEFEDTCCNEGNITNHHEEVAHMQTSFAKDVRALVSIFEELGNPFLENSSELLVLDTKKILDASVVKSIQSESK